MGVARKKGYISCNGVVCGKATSIFIGIIIPVVGILGFIFVIDYFGGFADSLVLNVMLGFGIIVAISVIATIFRITDDPRWFR
jgi:hypothetical protein